jgi:hypothetical protein
MRRYSTPPTLCTSSSLSKSRGTLELLTLHTMCCNGENEEFLRGPNSYRQGRARTPIPMPKNRSVHAPLFLSIGIGVHALMSHVITRAHAHSCPMSSQERTRTPARTRFCLPCWQMTWRLGYAPTWLNSNARALPLKRVRPYERALLMASLPFSRPSTSCGCP